MRNLRRNAFAAFLTCFLTICTAVWAGVTPPEATVAFEEYVVRSESGLAVIFPHPEGAEQSADYRLFVSGKEVFCYADRQFNPSAPKDEFNMTTSPQAYAIFDFTGEVEVEVEILNADLLAQTKKFIVTPRARKIDAKLDSNRLTFSLDRPGYYVVDPDGKGYSALQMLTALPEKTAPSPDDPNVIYFGPGVHDLDGSIVLTNNQTLYLAGGAVLRPLPKEYKLGWENGKRQAHYSGRSYERVVHAVRCSGAKNITIKGRGVITAQRGLPVEKRFGLFDLHHSENIRVEGITITDSSAWTLHLYTCSNSVIDGVRMMGWFTNSDGPCLNSCNNIQVRNCYVHTADDGLEIKTDAKGGWVHDILYEDCVLWADVGTAMGVTHEISSLVSNVVFRNHTVLHFKYEIVGKWDVPHRGAIFVHPALGGTVSDVLFENIVLESQDTPQPAILIYNGKHNRSPKAAYGHETPYSKIENVVFRNIQVLDNGPCEPSIVIYDHSPGGDLFHGIVLDHVGMLRDGQLEPLPIQTRGTPEILTQ